MLLADETGQRLLHGAAPSLPAAYNAAAHGLAIGPSAGSCGTAAFERKPVFVTDIAADPRWADFKDLAAAHGLGACHSTPILSSQGRLLGTIAMYYRRPHNPGAHDRQLIERATQLAAIAIERKQGEAARARLAAIIESSNDAIISQDLNSVITTWNQGAQRLFGYTEQEVIGRSISILIPPDLEDEELRMLERITRGESTDHYETVRRRKDGSLVDVSLTLSPIKDAHGQVIGASKIARDITEQKRAREERRRSRAFITSVVENLPNMIFVKDAKNLKFIRFNKAGEDLLGYSREDLIGKTDYDLFPKAEADFFTETDRQVLKAGRLHDIPEESIQTRDKGQRILHTKKIPLLDADGTPQYLLGISEDITERKRLEDAIPAGAKDGGSRPVGGRGGARLQ